MKSGKGGLGIECQFVVHLCCCFILYFWEEMFQVSSTTPLSIPHHHQRYPIMELYSRLSSRATLSHSLTHKIRFSRGGGGRRNSKATRSFPKCQHHSPLFSFGGDCIANGVVTAAANTFVRVDVIVDDVDTSKRWKRKKRKKCVCTLSFSPFCGCVCVLLWITVHPSVADV